MTYPSDSDRLRHMLEYSREVSALAAGKSWEDLLADRVLQLALARAVEIDGEAAARISDETKVKHPDLPWRQIVGMRNRLVHDYGGVDQRILWMTVTENIPRIVPLLEKIVGARD